MIELNVLVLSNNIKYFIYYIIFWRLLLNFIVFYIIIKLITYKKMNKTKKTNKLLINKIFKTLWKVRILKSINNQKGFVKNIIAIFIMIFWIIILPTPLPWILVILFWLSIFFWLKKTKSKILYLSFKMKIHKNIWKLKILKHESKILKKILFFV